MLATVAYLIELLLKLEILQGLYSERIYQPRARSAASLSARFAITFAKWARYSEEA